MNLSSIFFDFIEQNKNPAPFREAGFYKVVTPYFWNFNRY